MVNIEIDRDGIHAISFFFPFFYLSTIDSYGTQIKELSYLYNNRCLA